MEFDHVGIVVNDIETIIKPMSEYWDKKPSIINVPEFNAKACFIKPGNIKIEFIQPASDFGEIASFLKTQGEGIHHLSFVVDNLSEEIEKLRENGWGLSNKEVKIGERIKLIYTANFSSFDLTPNFVPSATLVQPDFD